MADAWEYGHVVIQAHIFFMCLQGNFLWIDI